MSEAFSNDQAARQYLEAALKDGVLPENGILPLSKWMQAIYLTDAGNLKVRAEHLAALLGIATGTAREVISQLRTVVGTPAMVAIGKKMLGTRCDPALIGCLVGSLLLLRQSLQLGSIRLDPALVGLG